MVGSDDGWKMGGEIGVGRGGGWSGKGREWGYEGGSCLGRWRFFGDDFHLGVGGNSVGQSGEDSIVLNRGWRDLALRWVSMMVRRRFW